MRFYALAQRPWIEEEGGGYWGLPPGTIGSIDLSASGARNRVFVTSDQPFAAGTVLAAFGDGTRLDQLALSGRARNDWNSLLGVSVPNGTILLDALWALCTTHADPTGATRAKPIMPTRKGVINLRLGGHGLLRSEKLPEDPTLHPAWGVMQQVLRNDYRAIYNRNETVARKWLGAQQIKLRLSDERVSELLIDDDLERVPPIRPTTTILDDFNRGNGGLNNMQATVAGVGQGWFWNARGASVSSNQIITFTSFGGPFCRQTTDELSSPDHYSQFVYKSETSFGHGPAVRMHASDHTWYCFRRHAGVFHLVRVVEGVGSNLDSATTALEANDLLSLEVDGSDLIVRRNGTAIITHSDSEISEGLRVGVGFHLESGGGVVFDDWEASDLVEAGADLVRVVAEAMGADEQRSRLVAITRQRSDEVGVGHALQRARSRSRRLVENTGIGEATQRPMSLFRSRGDDMAVSEAMVSIVEAIGAELVRVASEAVAATEAVARALGLTRRRHEVLGTAEIAVRLRALARRRSEMAALGETVRSAREMVRLRSEAATISETTAIVIDAFIAVVVRVVSEVIGMAEMAGRPRHRVRSREETVGLATAVVRVGGILGAAPAAIADRARMVVRAARRLIDRAATRFNVPPARR
jgi:hypothetical protein